jgi:hypothetical protein
MVRITTLQFIKGDFRLALQVGTDDVGVTLQNFMFAIIFEAVTAVLVGDRLT